MNKMKLLLVCFCSCLSFGAIAQEDNWEADPTYFDNIRHREILMNLTPLVSQFVPFNASTVSKFNIFDFETRRLKNGKGTRFGFGVNVVGEFNSVEPNSLYVRFGFIKSRQIGKQFHFFRSWDANLVAEDTDNNGRPVGKIGFSGFAISYSAGLKYNLSSRIALSTEGTLFLGLANMFDDGSPRIKFIPPVGLFLHVKL